MTIQTDFYAMDNKLGVDLNTVISSVGSGVNPEPPDYPAPPMKLGDRVQGNNGSEWVYVQASATVTAFNIIAIDSNYKVANATTAMLTSNLYAFGIAEFQGISSDGTSLLNAQPNDFFWAMLKCAQGARVNAVIAASVAPGSALYINSAQAGFVSNSAGVRLNGIFPVAGGTASVGGVLAMEVGMNGYILPAQTVSALPVSV